MRSPAGSATCWPSSAPTARGRTTTGSRPTSRRTRSTSWPRPRGTTRPRHWGDSWTIVKSLGEKGWGASILGPLAGAVGHRMSAVGAARALMRWMAVLATACCCLLATAGAAQAAPALPAGFEQAQVAAFGPGAGTIPDAAYPPDGRLLATEKDGRLWVKSGNAAPRLVLDISGHVN